VAEGERGQEVDHVGEDRGHIVELRAGDPADGLRLGYQHLGPHVRLGEPPQ
jgi:hypothetical protein